MQLGTLSSLRTDEALAWLTLLSLPPSDFHRKLTSNTVPGGGGVRHLVFEVVAEGTRTDTGDENNMTTRCNTSRHNMTIFFYKALFHKFQTLRSAWLIRLYAL